MEKVLINGIEYIGMNVNIPFILNHHHFDILENSYKRYSDACLADGCPYNDSLEDYLGMNILFIIVGLGFDEFLKELVKK